MTVINKNQICDGVDDYPVTDNNHYLVAEDESYMCPGEILVFLHIVASFKMFHELHNCSQMFICLFKKVKY